jgi:hypothetical protein
MDEADISLLFENAVRRAGLLVGRRLGHGNEFTIPQMTRHAAAEVFSSTTEGPARQVLIRKWEAAFRLLGEEMVRAAERIPNYPPDIVGEDSLSEAQIALGPFPPLW